MTVSAFLLTRDGNGEHSAYRIVNKWPHDADAFTQGLLYDGGFFYESTGLNGRSSLRRVDPATGEVLQHSRLHQRYFAEGLALVEDKLIQLTWKSGLAFVYDKDSFELLKTFSYPGQGWGLTYDGTNLIMSDGSDRLSFRDPASFEITRTLSVTENGRPIGNLNELEYIEGDIWANIWMSYDIAVISPQNGEVLRRIPLTGLPAAQDRNGREDVLNGIAYDAQKRRIFVTGKLYSHIYELEF
jgi:glutamine cyclotransferase